MTSDTIIPEGGFELVEYRRCDCGAEYCPGERETVVFEHQAKAECIHKMLMMGQDNPGFTGSTHYYDDKDRMDMHIMCPSGLKGVRKFRVQRVGTTQQEKTVGVSPVERLLPVLQTLVRAENYRKEFYQKQPPRGLGL